MKFLPLIFLSIFINQAIADTRSFGHLLTRNDYLIEEKNCAVGIQYVGCRIGNSTLIGVSPFLLNGYNQKSIYIRQRISTSEEINNTIDLGLVNNLHEVKNTGHYYNLDETYDMSAVMLNLITTFNSASNTKLHWNNSIFYYPNYRRPFSLRRPDPNVKKLQLNSSVLFESPFSKHITMASEFGFLQFNGKYPRIQGGASLDFHGEYFLLKIGFSVTSTLPGFFVNTSRSARNDYQQELLLTEDGFYQELDERKVKYDFAVHPEINVQYTF